VSAEPSSVRRRQRLQRDRRDVTWLSEQMRRADEGGFQAVASARYLSDVAEELGGVVALSGGTIGDMVPPDFVREAARDAIEAYPHYPGIKGFRDLRVAIATKLLDYNQIVAEPDDEVLPTIGCQQVIDGTFRILVDPGDEVLVFTPEYGSTEPPLRMAGARVVHVPLAYDGTTWRFDPDALEARASRSTKLLAMSNPHNPTGIVFTPEQLAFIADLAKTLDFWVFSDEEYERTLYDGRTHTSIAALPGMAERTVSGFSFSKPYAMTAYRIGYMVAPAAVMDHMHTILRVSIQACSAVGMRAAHAVLTNDMTSWLRDSIESLDRKRLHVVERLNAMDGVTCHLPEGVYFAFPDIRALGRSSFEVAEHALRSERVSIVPGTGFGPGGEGHVRVSYCPAISTIDDGLDRLERAFRRLT
jgi:aspartate/methionine/tyrosine aminotransferase